MIVLALSVLALAMAIGLGFVKAMTRQAELQMSDEWMREKGFLKYE